MHIARTRWVVLLSALGLAVAIVAALGLGTADAKQRTHAQQQTTQAQGSSGKASGPTLKSKLDTYIDVDSLPESSDVGQATDGVAVPSHPAADKARYDKEKKDADSGQGYAPKGEQIDSSKAPKDKGSTNSTSGVSPSLSTTSSFTGISRKDESTLGYKGFEPPDTQLAAGPNYLLEMVNATGRTYSKSTLQPVKTFDLHSFWPIPSGWNPVDPRVIYDPIKARFVATTLAIDPTTNNTQVWVAVSPTSDPTGTWTALQVGNGTTNGTIEDQPMVGVSNDKILVSWNDVCESSACGTPNNYLGQETWALDYAPFLSGSGTVNHTSVFGQDTSRFRIVPAHTLTSQSTENMIYNIRDAPAYPNGYNGSYTGVIQVKGTPAAGNITWYEADMDTVAPSTPPKAVQPSGLPLDTTDDRFLSAVTEGGVLWTVGASGCSPSGDTTIRACLHLVQANVSSSPTYTMSSILGSVGDYYFTPGVTMDGNKDSFFTYSHSSSTTYPEARVADRYAGSTSIGLSNLMVLRAGQKAYSSNYAPGGYYRWGDYCGGGPDPTSGTTLDASHVWLACEYSTSDTISGTAGSANGNWGTVGAREAA